MSSSDSEEEETEESNLHLDLSPSFELRTQSPSERDQCTKEREIGIQVSTQTLDSTTGILALTDRLRHIFECNVCYEVPHPDEMNQCLQGHIICDNCVHYILTEARVNGQDAFCPHCRMKINIHELTRNTVVRQTMWELPRSCPKCDTIRDYKSLLKHMNEECEKRLARCRNYCIGCDWEDALDQCPVHEKDCIYPSKSGKEIMKILLERDEVELVAMRRVDRGIRQFCSFRVFYENIEFRWTQDNNFDCLGELTLSSKVFYAFEEQWIMNLRLKSIDNTIPHSIGYSLALHSRCTHRILVSYFAVMPSSQSKPKHLDDIPIELRQQDFTSDVADVAEFFPLFIKDSQAVCRLLSVPVMSLRLWMFIQQGNKIVI